MLSIICVYNNKDILQKYLLKSLNEQKIEFETILVDNSNKKFNSAAEALNHGAEKSTGDILVFVHQDICFCPENLKEIKEYYYSVDNLGIAGVAGVSETKKGVISNINHGSPPEPCGINSTEDITPVQTLDECIVIIPKEVFIENKFDQYICDDWHLYVVDYCLNIKSKGYKVVIFPLELYHRSPGYSMSEKYYLTMQKLLKKHRKNYTWIYTSLGNYNTHLPLKMQLNIKKPIIYLLKKIGKWNYS